MLSKLLRRPTLTGSLLTLLVLLALSLALIVSRFHAPTPPMDEGVLLIYPDLILRGYMPCRDFAPLYTPGAFYLIAGAFSLFGHSILVERAVGAAFQILIVWAMYMLGQRVGWFVGILAAATTLIEIHIFPFPGAYSAFGSIAAAMWALFCASAVFESTDSATQMRRSAIAGVLVGCAVWLRQDIGALAAVSTLIALDPTCRPRLLGYMGGLSAPLILLGVFFITAGPAVVIDSLVLDVIRQSPGRLLPIEPNAHLLTIVVCTAASVLLAFTSGREVDGEPATKRNRWLTRSIAVMTLGLMPSMLRRADLWHYAYTGSVVLALTVISLGAFQSPRVSRLWGVRVLMMISVVAAIAAQISPSVRSLSGWRNEQPEVRSGNRWVYWYPMTEDANDDYLAIQRLISAVNGAVSPGERLFVGPRDLRFAMHSDTFLYFLFPQLQPVSRYLDINPGAANRKDSGIAAAIARADWLILTSRYDGYKEQNMSSLPGPDLPNEVVERMFCLHSEHGPWLLMRRCRQAARGAEDGDR